MPPGVRVRSHSLPVLRLCLPLMAGVVAGWYWPEGVRTAWLAGAAGLLLLTLNTWANRRRLVPLTRLYALALTVLMAALGWCLTAQRLSRLQTDLDGRAAPVRVRLTDDPVQKTSFLLCRATLMAQLDSTGLQPAARHDVLLYFEADSLSASLRRGDVVDLVATFRAPRNSSNPFAFDTRRYLLSRGVSLTAWVAAGSWSVAVHEADRSLRGRAAQCRSRLLAVFERYHIGGERFAVLAALTLGYRDRLDPDLRQAYANAGALHVLAVSGLHVGILYLLLSSLLLPVRRRRGGEVVCLPLLVGFLWFYAFLTGLSPSVMRSALMFSVVAVGRAVGRRTQVLNSIALAALVLLMTNPLSLFDVSFQLSFASVTAIVVFAPRLAALWQPRSRVVWRVWQLVCVSVAAQIGSLPITLYCFHQFSLYFALANLVVIPVAYLLLGGTVLLFTLAGLPAAAGVVARMLSALTGGLNAAVRMIDALPHSTVQVWFSLPAAVLLGAAVVCVLCFVRWKRAFWLFLSAGSLEGMMLCFVLRYAAVPQTDRLVVYSDRQADVVQLTRGYSQVLITTDSVRGLSLSEGTTVFYHLLPPRLVMPDSTGLQAFRFDGQRYLLISGPYMKGRMLSAPAEADCVIIGNVGRTRPRELLASLNAPRLVLLGSLPRWQRDSLAAIGRSRGLEVHDVLVDGACIHVERRERDGR